RRSGPTSSVFRALDRPPPLVTLALVAGRPEEGPAAAALASVIRRTKGFSFFNFKGGIAMAITRYDPFRDLFRLQDQLFKTFGEAYAPREESGLTAAWTPAVDVFEDADSITLKVELPEVDAKDVEIQVEAKQLTGRCERKRARAGERGGLRRSWE